MMLTILISVVLSAVFALGAASAAPSADPLPGSSTFTITSPAPGAFLSGPPRIFILGTAQNAQLVEVNGRPATISGSDWVIPYLAEFGTNTFSLKVVDTAGNVAQTSWSVLYSPTYLPAAQLVPDAAVSRLSTKAVNQVVPIAVNALVQGGALQRAIQSVPGSILPGHVDYHAVSFGLPRVSVGLEPSALRLAIDLPNLVVDADFAGGSLDVAASDAHVEAILVVAATDGKFVAIMPETPTVKITNFVAGAPHVPKGLVGAALGVALQTALPPLLTTVLNGAVGPHTFTYLDRTLTIESRPSTIEIDPAGVTTAVDGNVTAPVDPRVPAAPGSISRTGGAAQPPSFTTSHDVALALREDILNRTLYAAWQGGFMNLELDRAALTRLGINLPFQLDSSFLVPFFPALQAFLPPGQPVPMALNFDPVLPPVLELGGAPQLLTAGWGELHLSVDLDFSRTGHWQSILKAALHFEAGADVSLLNDRLVVTLGDPTRTSVALLQNPLGLSQADIDRFLQVLAPSLVPLLSDFIPPIPLPPLPFGLPFPQAVDLRQDGPGADYLTVSSDLP